MLENVSLRKAVLDEVDAIWEILEQAILKRKEEGSDQWQDGYPNIDVIKNDLLNDSAYVVVQDDSKVIAYVAISDKGESAYENLDGEWLTNDKYVVIHRVAVSQENKIKGLGTWIMLEAEKVAISKNITSIKVDTNYDNTGMLRVFEKLDYKFCGEVSHRGDIRKAFEKILTKN